MERTLEQTFDSHCILQTIVSHNGTKYGRNHTFVKIKFKNIACTSMELNGKQVDEFEFTFRLHSERKALISSLKMIVKELEDNPDLIDDSNSY